MKYEYEERAFLSEDDFLRIKDYLDKTAKGKEFDNKKSYFFVMPDCNLSVAVSDAKALVKYKSGQIAKGNGFEEHEFPFDPKSIDEAIGLFTSLAHIQPQQSEQFRINYFLDGDIEIALKYTASWGFHIEIEKVYTATGEQDKAEQQQIAQNDVEAIVKLLDIKLITLADMDIFSKDCLSGINKGEFSPDEFRKKYGQLFTAE